MTQAPSEKGFFVQYPNILISGCPDLNRDDKWVLLSLMQDFRIEAPFYLTYREIEGISGVPLSLLSSYTNKKTGVFREGCMDRIARVTGYLSFSRQREIDKAGKPFGNAKLCITIHYSKIWQDNKAYCETRVSNPVSYANKLGLYDKPVSYANKFEEEPVSITNDLVSHANEPVRTENKPVPYANDSVSHANRLTHMNKPVEASETPPIDSNKIDRDIHRRKREERVVPPQSPSPDTSLHSSPDRSFSSETQGEVNLPPASVKGESLSIDSGGNDAATSVAASDTSNLANDTQPSTGSGDSGCVPTEELTEVTQANLPIVAQTDTTMLDEQQSSSDTQGYTNSSGCEEAHDKDAVIDREMILTWAKTLMQEEIDPLTKQRRFALGRAKSQKEAVEKLTGVVASMDDLRCLYTRVRARFDGIIYLKNLANDDVIEEWQQAVESKNGHDQTMDRVRAEEFARSLLGVYPPELLGIDRSYPGQDKIWSTCIQYAPDRWLYFENPEHYAEPSAWERECIEEAIAYGKQFVQPLEAAV
jgi:hypothetical protein